MTLMDGFQSFSSLRMLRQTVPEGKTLGWKKPAGKRHLGGCVGKSSVNSIVSGNTPPSHRVCRALAIPFITCANAEGM